eukprot:s1711_g2.t1
MAEYDEDAVADLISRIQVFCYPRRIRVKEFFNDFDPLRRWHGRCTIINFARALDTLGMQGLTDEEVDNLAEHFTEHGAHVAPPQVVNYVKFCEAIDRVDSCISSNEQNLDLIQVLYRCAVEKLRMRHSAPQRNGFQQLHSSFSRPVCEK